MNKLLRFVAWVEILSGVAAAGYAALAVVIGRVSGLAFFSVVVLAVLSLLSVAAGVVLLMASRLGWLGSVALQVLQLPSLSLGTVLYRLGLGLSFSLGIYLPEISASGGNVAGHLQFGLGVDFAASFGMPLPEQYVAVNVVALVLLVSLLHKRPGRARQEPNPSIARTAPSKLGSAAHVERYALALFGRR